MKKAYLHIKKYFHKNDKKLLILWLFTYFGTTLCAKNLGDSLAKTSTFNYKFFFYETHRKNKLLKPEVRPFITDDSRVVGKELAQIESWTRLDKDNFQWWALAAYGPTEWLELTAGGVFGWDIHPKQGFAYSLPLIQAKFLFKEYAPNKMPGIGAVVGTFLPYGQGSFKPPGYGTFGFLTLSQCFGEGEKVLIHANTGFNYLHIAGENEWLHTWGFGTQIKTYKGFHLVAEIFSGDPYVPGSGTSWQAGFRHFISEEIQIDGTIGKGIAGDEILPLWGSVGIRLVFDWFKKKE